MNKKVALVGTGSGEFDAPFNDPEYDIWVLNWNIAKYPRVTLGFEMHDTRNGQPVIPGEYKDDETGEIVPCITQKNFPFDKVEALNKPFFSTNNYYKSSLDYMVAKAIVDGYEEIAVYGVDMSVDNDEYFRQQPSFRSWLSLAIGMGINVTVCDSSPLMKSTYIYGRDEPRICVKPFTMQDFTDVKAQHQEKVDELTAINRELKAKIDANLRAMDTHMGCIQLADRLINVSRAVESGQKIDKLINTAKVV